MLHVMSLLPEDAALHLRLARAAQTAMHRAESRARRLLDQVPLAKRLLLERYDCRHVWIFGSLVTQTFSDSSDVNLAVDHLSASSYALARAELTEVFHTRVNLVRMEDATDSLRLRILREGRRV